MGEDFLGCLHDFRVDCDSEQEVFAYDFTCTTTRTQRRSKQEQGSQDPLAPDYDVDAADYDPAAEANKERENLIRQHRQSGRLVSAYLPALLFGPSPRSGLSRRQVRILMALTRETTRAHRSSTREDKAQLVIGGQTTATNRQTNSIPGCPYLLQGIAYVAFNGNGSGNQQRRRRYHGRGYRLLGRTSGWLPRAPLPAPNDGRGPWKAVRGFLKDLDKLAGPFGLVAAGWHSDEHQWRSLDDMIAPTKTRAGRSWLRKCLLRVYTPADYLIRWRRYFADRLGFSVIPGDDKDAEAPVVQPLSSEITAITSAVDLDRWMSPGRSNGRSIGGHAGPVAFVHQQPTIWTPPLVHVVSGADCTLVGGKVTGVFKTTQV